MTEEVKLTAKQWHEKNACDLFNSTWTLIDKKDRTTAEIFDMIHMAHASRYHWGQIGQPVHFERGEWQISRVYCLLEMPESALFHAKRCLEICSENNIGDWDIAFAYEAVARSYKIAKDRANLAEYLELAKKAGESIREKDDRDYLFSELKTIEN